jgi:N-acetylmuramoyl-L-alanine amidase
MKTILALIAALFIAPFASAAPTEAEVLDMARVVYAEALGERSAGRQAVAAVILNRAGAKGFPKTITGVLTQRNAFSCRLDGGSPLYRHVCTFTLLTPDAQWQAVVRDVRAAVVKPDAALKGVVFYRAPALAHRFPGMRAQPVFVRRIGNHDFFRLP